MELKLRTLFECSNGTSYAACGGILTLEQDFETKTWNSFRLVRFSDDPVNLNFKCHSSGSDTDYRPTSDKKSGVAQHQALSRHSVMALLSVLTPVLALVLCLVIGFLLRSKNTETTSRAPGQNKGVSKTDFRPWVDQDLQDDTEVTAGGGGG